MTGGRGCGNAGRLPGEPYGPKIIAPFDSETPTPAPDPGPPERLDRRFLAFFSLASGLALAPLWTAAYPPMVDLAQHAAQVSTWHRWNDPGFDYSQYFWVNWRTPYFVTNFLAYVLAYVLPVAAAFQVVFSLAVVGLPWATLALLRLSGAPLWWAFLLVPAGYGFAFYMGFVAFACAVPLALLFVALSWRYARSPDARRAWWLLGTSQVLFFTHTIAFGWAGLTGALLVAAHAPDLRSTLRRWWPFVLALLLPGAWLVTTVARDGIDLSEGGQVLFDPSRLLQAVSFTVGLPVHDLGLVLGALVLALPFLLGGRPSRQRTRWIPLAVSVVLFLITPKSLFGTGYLHQRFAVFFLPTLLFALDPPRAPVRATRRLILGAVAVLWLGLVQTQVLAFRAETGAFGELLDTMEPDRIVLYLPLDARSRSLPFPAYLHFGSWYQVEKGGLAEFSFSSYFPNRYRYHPEQEDALPRGFEFRPWIFDWHEHDGRRYDYFLLRSSQDPGPLFRRIQAPVRPLASASGGWWLYAPLVPPEERAKEAVR